MTEMGKGRKLKVEGGEWIRRKTYCRGLTLDEAENLKFRAEIG